MNFSKTFLAGLLAFVVGNILIAVLWSLFVMGIVGALSATTGIDDNSILRIDLSENIVEAPPADPFAGVDFRTMTATPHVTLFEALRAIDAAKSDPRIKGIYIRPNGQGTVSMAVLEELRAAILDFKQESGKFVLAYNEAYGQGGYYLATAADGVQGAARQTRSQSRGVPSYGLQVQECRGTLHPHEAVRCQSGTVGAAGALDVERHCG